MSYQSFHVFHYNSQPISTESDPFLIYMTQYLIRTDLSLYMNSCKSYLI